MIEFDAPGYLNVSLHELRMYVSNRITVLSWILMLAVFIGCNGEDHSAVPVSITVNTPFTYEGRIGRIWGGDNFEVVDNGQLHYAYVRGINSPEPGQPFYEEAKVKLRELTQQRKATISVINRDGWKCEVCTVEVADPETGKLVDPAFELVRTGLAWYDESDGPYAESYRKAENLARAEKIGIWSQPNPVPPWEFWEQQVKQIQQASSN